MIVPLATLLGMLSVKLFGGKLKRLATVDLRHLWVVWATIFVQTMIFEVPFPFFPVGGPQVLHIATYVSAFVFLWLNRHIPGALLIAVGAAGNAAAITANGGVMPARPSAWARAGLPRIDGFENSNVVDDAPLWFLGDIFAIPAGWPLANVFSIGDVVIVIGGTYFAHAWCRRPATSNAWPAPAGMPAGTPLHAVN